MSNSKFSVKNCVILPLLLVLTLVLFFMPTEWFGIEGLTLEPDPEDLADDDEQPVKEN